MHSLVVLTAIQLLRTGTDGPKTVQVLAENGLRTNVPAALRENAFNAAAATAHGAGPPHPADARAA